MQIPQGWGPSHPLTGQRGVNQQMSTVKWPYTLPIWRRFHRAVSPDGQRVAQIDPAYEIGMSNPTSGLLCVTGGPHLERCNPSFVWSDDSRYLAVPQFHGFFARQRILIVVFEQKCVFASRERASYFQPESFSVGQLIVTINPFRSARVMNFEIPSELSSRFTRLERRDVRWPESP
jgi:hypothetical protein